MKLYHAQAKSTPGWNYWGDYDDIEVGISSGLIAEAGEIVSDPLHYHRQGIVFIVVLEGLAVIEVNGQEVEVAANQVLKIEPGEKYRHLPGAVRPTRWLTFCTVKDKEDKVVEE